MQAIDEFDVALEAQIGLQSSLMPRTVIRAAAKQHRRSLRIVRQSPKIPSEAAIKFSLPNTYHHD